MKILFVNATMRQESRTFIIAKKIMDDMGYTEYEEVVLAKEDIKPLNPDTLEKRTQLIEKQEYDDEMFRFARKFATADVIIIAAPFWDLGFPALLKCYLENIAIAGLTFKYNNGVPETLIKAKKLIYITTSGGKIFADFGYTYVKTLVNAFYEITDVVCYCAEQLDEFNISCEDVLEKAEIKILE